MNQLNSNIKYTYQIQESVKFQYKIHLSDTRISQIPILNTLTRYKNQLNSNIRYTYQIQESVKFQY